MGLRASFLHGKVKMSSFYITVTDHFEQFNRDYYKVCEVFKKVNNQEFKAGQEVVRFPNPHYVVTFKSVGESD